MRRPGVLRIGAGELCHRERPFYDTANGWRASVEGLLERVSATH